MSSSLSPAEPTRTRASVRIGALVPLSRPGWFESGRHLLAGLELAVREINDGGGIDGQPIDLRVRDTAADPQQAAGLVQELADTGIEALAGEYHSVVAHTVATKADALGLPFLCSSAVLDRLTHQDTDWVARLAPAQSQGWRIYADFLVRAGHRRVAAVAQSNMYWAAGTRILREQLARYDAELVELHADAFVGERLCDELARHRVSALLLLVGYPEPAVSIVKWVRRDARLPGMLIGAPAGQPELSEWLRLLGPEGAAIPFLRYMPAELNPLGRRVDADLREQLNEAPSFVAFEGYDTMAALAEFLRLRRERQGPAAESWQAVDLEGTRGRIRFSRQADIPVWQWAWPPVQVVDRDPADPHRLRVLHSG